ncbi:hypothetical protein GCM10008955_42020 [Deinococcus malanensis]|uniref:Uncharacterized protein n=1 Tax=Deinococcus malanensis TaxID=1706855 RepID=A0ABQ2F2A0_9DEIO|nr:hypothetical protein GCM10008955_42020 [Deinococcus malanensis]
MQGSNLSVRANPAGAEAVGWILTDTSFVQALEEAAQASLTPGESYRIKGCDL